MQRLVASTPPATLGAARDPLDDRVVDNMLAGYAFVDALVAEGVDVLAMGQLRHLLEMNTLVLCGTDPARRVRTPATLRRRSGASTKSRGGGIEDLVEWHARHRRDPVWDLAAGAYVRIAEQAPALRRGQPPNGRPGHELPPASRRPAALRAHAADSAAGYFELSSELRSIDKGAPGAFFPLAGIAHRLAALLTRHADPRHLRS